MSPTPAQRRSLHWSVPELGQLRGELGDGDRAAGHLEAGDVVADQATGDGDAVAAQPLGDRREDHVQLDERGPAQPVDHHQHVTGQRQVRVDGLQRDTRDLLRRYQPAAGPAGFTVDAHAELDLVLAQLEARLTGRRYRARGQRDTERAGPVVDLATERHRRGQVGAPLRRRADDLLDEHGRAGTPPAGGPRRVLHGHVVVDDHGLDPHPVVTRELGGHLEVEHVAGVVLHDVQYPGTGVDRLRGGQDLVRYR